MPATTGSLPRDAAGRLCAGMTIHLTGTRPRAFDGKVESMMADSQDGANQIQHPHWDKGASHEWGSLIPTICANVPLRQSKPVIPVRNLLTCSKVLLVLLAV